MIVSDKATPSSRTEASSTPEHSIRTSSSKQICTKTSLMFGMQLDGIISFPLRSMVLDSSPSNFFALFGRWKMGFIFDFSGKNIYFLGKLLPATSISTNTGRFLSIKLAAVLIIMNFGAKFGVMLSMASSHLGAATFITQLFS
jgi:hypothetical protein